jgi:hypothetical protein
VRFVVRDRDAKFCRSFDDVFGFERAEVLVTPAQAPRANAYAERWVRTVRAECLDWLLIVGRGHLEQVLRIYIHYNRYRPHWALGLAAPDPVPGWRLSARIGKAGCVDVTCLAGSSRSTSELHEHLYAPHRGGQDTLAEGHAGVRCRGPRRHRARQDRGGRTADPI